VRQDVTLSHRLGPHQIITTRLETIADHKAGIAWELLSKTFRDSIAMTRDLSVDYVWIDSSCIIQDSVCDWSIEASQMADVYGGARLTITGTSASRSHLGFF
jgi:hypothetical protein